MASGVPDPVQIRVAQNAEQPGLGPAGIAQLVQLQLRLAEGVLGQVLGVAGLAAQPVGIAVQGQVVLFHQLLDPASAAGQTHGDGSLRSMTPRQGGLFPEKRRRRA